MGYEKMKLLTCHMIQDKAITMSSFRIFFEDWIQLVVFTKPGKGDNFCEFLFASVHTKPLSNGVYSKTKELAPTLISTQSSNFLIFRLQPVYFLSTSLFRHITWVPI